LASTGEDKGPASDSDPCATPQIQIREPQTPRAPPRRRGGRRRRQVRERMRMGEIFGEICMFPWMLPFRHYTAVAKVGACTLQLQAAQRRVRVC
jgi:hypothetical protein